MTANEEGMINSRSVSIYGVPIRWDGQRWKNTESREVIGKDGRKRNERNGCF